MLIMGTDRTQTCVVVRRSSDDYNQDVDGELILDCKVEDLEVLHEYFRPGGCIKYCL